MHARAQHTLLKRLKVTLPVCLPFLISASAIAVTRSDGTGGGPSAMTPESARAASTFVSSMLMNERLLHESSPGIPPVVEAFSGPSPVNEQNHGCLLEKLFSAWVCPVALCAKTSCVFTTRSNCQCKGAQRTCQQCHHALWPQH